MKKTLGQQGFSIGIVIASLVVIVGLALGGYFVWQNNKDDSGKKTDSNSSQNKDSDNDKEQSNDLSESGKYLVIDEWGVRAGLPEGLRGDLLTYKSNTNVSGTILFASKKLNALAGDDSCNLVKQPSGSYSGGLQTNLVRINLSTYPEDALESYKRDLDHITKIGDYDYYARKPAELTCATAVGGDDPIPGLYDSEQEISEQLKEALKTLEAIE